MLIQIRHRHTRWMTGELEQDRSRRRRGTTTAIRLMLVRIHDLDDFDPVIANPVRIRRPDGPTRGRSAAIDVGVRLARCDAGRSSRHQPTDLTTFKACSSVARQKLSSRLILGNCACGVGISPACQFRCAFARLSLSDHSQTCVDCLYPRIYTPSWSNVSSLADAAVCSQAQRAARRLSCCTR